MYPVYVDVSKGATRLLRRGMRKFQVPDGMKLSIAMIFCASVPSTRNLRATEGVKPLSLRSFRFAASEMRIITVSDPVSNMPE